MERSPRTLTAVVPLLSSLALLLFFVLFLVRELEPAPRPEPPGPAASEPRAERRLLRFGRTPNLSPREAYRTYRELVELLNDRLECCRLELVLAPDYAECVNMLGRGELEVAWLGLGSYLRHRHRVPMRLLVRPLWQGQEGYAGIIFTVEGSGLRTLAQLRGRRLAFVDPESASGYLYPARLLAEAGLDLRRDFAGIDFLGSHDAVLMSVLLGESDAGAVFERAFATISDRARTVRMRTLARTSPIAAEPVVASPALEEAVVAELTQAFLSLPVDRLSRGELVELFGFEAVATDYYEGIDLPEPP